jgi:hypothetical protein
MKTIKQILQEAQASHIMNAIGGQVPNIKSYAILTAENPHGEAHGPIENEEEQKKLKEKLRNSGLGFIQIKGKYGSVENPFFIPNISQEQASKLGKQFGQRSIIHGEKNSKGQMVHSYIFGDEVVQQRKTFNQLQKDIDDFYSTVKGRKFNIPYYDSETQNQEFQGGKIVNRQGTNPSDKPDPPKKPGSKVGKSSLLNPSGRVVWVKNQNLKKYQQMGYKQNKEN